MNNKKRVAVLGGGSFGTALCNLVAENGHDATLWLRNEERANEINSLHRNSYYLPEFILHNNVHATTDLNQAVASAEVIFVAVPSGSCRSVSEKIKRLINNDAIIISTTKGIEHENFKLMSQIIRESLPDNPLGVLSGPNLAKEIMAKAITGTVIASKDQLLTERIQTLLHCEYFRVYASSDVYGVELGGALKNIYAIVAGMAAAMDLGANTKAMIMTRSLAEMSRFAVTMGADPLTFLGLAGVGDLIVTCTSPLSRNYQVGFAIGNGQTLKQASDDLGQVAEGVNTLKLVKREADRLNVYMPLVQALHEILYNGKSVADAVTEIMLSAQNEDVEFTF